MSCSVGEDCSRWSHMCGNWYLPRFLMSVGSCTWMNMDSLMVLERLLTSLSSMLNCSGSNGCPEVALCWWIGEGVLRWSLTLLPEPYLIPLCMLLGNLCEGISNDIWCLFGWFWGLCPWSFLIVS